MKKYIISCGVLLLSLCVQAQQKWTLRQCVDYAVQNNIELKQQEIKVRNSDISLSTTKNSRLPNLNASVGQSFSFGQSQNYSTGVYSSNNASGTDFSIGTSIPVFTGFRIPNQVKADEFNLMAATEGLKKAQENLELQVVSYYLDVLFKKEILKVFQEQILLTQQQVERTSTLVESGKVPASQLYDIKAQLAKDELNVTTSNNDLTLSLLNLSQLLNLTDQENFDIEEPVLDNIADEAISSIIPPNQVYNMALGIKPHVKEAEYKLENTKKLLKVAQAGYWPTIDLSLSYSNGFNHFYNSPGSNPSVSTQLKNNAREYIGISLKIPIFDRFQTRNNVRSARLSIENQSLELDNVKLALYKEIQQAYQSATSAQAKYNSTTRAFEAAEESFKYARERYDIGKSTVFEYNEAQTKLLSSKSERIQSKYDFIFRSKILDFYQGKEIDIE